MEATINTGKQNKVCLSRAIYQYIVSGSEFHTLQVDLSAVLGSLHSPFASRLAGKVDVLVFNPPYVPTEEEEGDSAQIEGSLSAAWAGGAIGMTTTEAVIEAAPVRLDVLSCFDCHVQLTMSTSARDFFRRTDAST